MLSFRASKPASTSSKQNSNSTRAAAQPKQASGPFTIMERYVRLDRMCSDVDLELIYPNVWHTHEEYMAARRRLGLFGRDDDI